MTFRTLYEKNKMARKRRVDVRSQRYLRPKEEQRGRVGGQGHSIWETTRSICGLEQP
jgi:hypothetical protein